MGCERGKKKTRVRFLKEKKEEKRGVKSEEARGGGLVSTGKKEVRSGLSGRNGRPDEHGKKEQKRGGGGWGVTLRRGADFVSKGTGGGRGKKCKKRRWADGDVIRRKTGDQLIEF